MDGRRLGGTGPHLHLGGDAAAGELGDDVAAGHATASAGAGEVGGDESVFGEEAADRRRAVRTEVVRLVLEPGSPHGFSCRGEGLAASYGRPVPGGRSCQTAAPCAARCGGCSAFWRFSGSWPRAAPPTTTATRAMATTTSRATDKGIRAWATD